MKLKLCALLALLFSAASYADETPFQYYFFMDSLQSPEMVNTLTYSPLVACSEPPTEFNISGEMKAEMAIGPFKTADDAMKAYTMQIDLVLKTHPNTQLALKSMTCS